jgi:hypothetical protein
LVEQHATPDGESLYRALGFEQGWYPGLRTARPDAMKSQPQPLVLEKVSDDSKSL